MKNDKAVAFSEWEHAFVFFAKPDINGGYVHSYCMRRRVNGQMQFRAESDSERIERVKDEAW